MELSQVKVGQTVRIARPDLFYHCYVGDTALVTVVRGENVHVAVISGDNEGETDYGRASGLELIKDVEVVSGSVKDAIAKVETALAELKALVG